MSRATVIGSGPNGLAAAVSLARAGYDVEVLEASDTVGGGLRTVDGPIDGFRYDVCSAVHPAALTSPFFRAFGLHERVSWIRPEISYAHPLDGDRAAIAWRDLDRTAEDLGTDARAWRALAGPLVRHLDDLVTFTGDALWAPPRRPATGIRYGLRMLQHGLPGASTRFRSEEAAALLAGVIAHANTPLPSLAGAAAGLLLAAHGHSDDGWAYPRGGAQMIADALSSDLTAHGGKVTTGRHVRTLATLDWGDPARGDLLLLNTSPQLALTHPDIPAAYARRLRAYRYGPAAAKVDFALDGPVPWAHPDVALSPTVHLGGTRAEIWASENAVARGTVSDRPYVLAVQPSVFDESRAPRGHSALWTYIHVPSQSRLDPTELVIRQVERFAPGFRSRIIAHHAVPASEREAINAAEIGGDVFGGAFTLSQALRRPVLSRTPWRTPMRGVYLASAATPPGPGVNGMAGWHAARTALADAGTPLDLSDIFPS